MSPHLILVADEHDLTRAFLAEQLAADGYEVLLAENRRHAQVLLVSHRPQLVLADLNGHTLGLLDTVRGGDGLGGQVDPHTPMIVLTSRAGELERVRALERGGDDVVAKPFSYPELRARIAAVLRRSHMRPGARILRAGPIAIDMPAREVRVSGRPVELSAKEYQLLLTLAGDATRVFTREELLRGIWGSVTFGRTRTLESHICRLRRKLTEAGETLVINRWGVGYQLMDRPAETAR